MKSTNEQQGDTVREGFRNRRVFSTKKEWAGIPSDLFVCGAGVSVGLFFSVAWWLGLSVGIVYFSVIYRIHKEDPRAAKAWFRGMTRKHNYWAAGEVEPITVTFLSSGQEKNTQREEVQNEIDCLV